MSCISSDTTRPLPTTLISCASTLALSLAASWGDPSFSDSESQFFNIFLTLALPWFPLFRRLMCTLYVGFVQRLLLHPTKNTSAAADDHGNDKRSCCFWPWNGKYGHMYMTTSEVGIMSACSIAIPIPATLDSHTMAKVRSMERGDCIILRPWPEVEKESLVALRPRACCEKQSSDGDAVTIMEDLMISRVRSKETTTAAATSSSSAAITDLDLEDTQLPVGAEYYSGEYLYFQGARGDVEPEKMSLKDRVVLLELQLVPPYKHLRSVRTRTRFQAVITLLQTLGFMLGLAERLSQRLSLSPTEVLAFFYALIAVVQVGLDLHACAFFEKTLVLSLSHDQFKSFIHHPRRDDSDYSQYYLRWFNIVLVLTFLVQLAVASYAAVHFTIHYWHVARISTRTSFPLFIASYLCGGAASMALRLFMRVENAELSGLLVLLAMLGTAAAIVVAVVATVSDWEQLFGRAGRSTFSWILPHVNGGT